ncbi:hypothetical protein D3C71_1019170 [compost metagenome]
MVSSVTRPIMSLTCASVFSCRPSRFCTVLPLSFICSRAARLRSKPTAVPEATGSSLAVMIFLPVASCCSRCASLLCLESIRKTDWS